MSKGCPLGLGYVEDDLAETFLRLGILAFALMVVCIAVSLALMIMTCVLKARTRQRDEMEARVEELQSILNAKAEAMRNNENTNGATNDTDQEQKPTTTPRKSESSAGAISAADNAGGHAERSDALLRTLSATSAPSVAPPYTYAQEQGHSWQARHLPLPDSVPSFDHSKGEAFTSSPETISTPISRPMPAHARTMPELHTRQQIYNSEQRGPCPPNVAWLSDVLVASPEINDERQVGTDNQ